MKTIYKAFAMVSSMMIVLISCTTKDYFAQKEAHAQTILQMQENKIAGGDFTLSPDDAIKVALLNDINSTDTKSAQAKSVKDVVTIKGKSNDPIIYAVNYNDNKGFTLISASKDYYPVLAMVDKGEFGPDCYKTGMAVLLEEYEHGIEYCKTLPEDSLKTFKALWRQYETGRHVVNFVSSARYFYMDWGYFGNHNGWFLDDSINILEGNFSLDRIDIICSPNRVMI